MTTNTQTTDSHGNNNSAMSHSAAKQLVDAQSCLNILFPNQQTAPSVRTFWAWKAKRWIPFVKIGKLVLFDPVEVRRVIDKRFTVHSVMD